MIWAWLGVMVADFVLQRAVATLSKPDDRKPDAGSLDGMPTIEQGRPLPVVFGTCRVSSPGIMASRVPEIFNDVNASPPTYRYRWQGALAVCCGPVDDVLGIWWDNLWVPPDYTGISDEIFPCKGDPVNNWSGIAPATAPNCFKHYKFNSPDLWGADDGVYGDVDVYYGSNDDGLWVDPWLYDWIGDRSTYPSICYAVVRRWRDWENETGGTRLPGHSGMPNMQYDVCYRYAGTQIGGMFVCLTGCNYGNSPYLRALGIEVERCPTIVGGSPALTSGHHRIDAGSRRADGATYYEANPACVVYDLLCNTYYGAGLPTTMVDVQSFISAAETLWTEGLGGSWQMDRTTTVLDFLATVLTFCNATLQTDPLTGKLKLKLVRQLSSGEIAALITLDEAHLEPIQRHQGQWAETVNRLTVTWADRASAYETKAGSLENTAALWNGVVDETLSIDGATCQTVAQKVGMVALRAMSQPLNKYTLVADRTGWALRPGDAFHLVWRPFSVDSIVRVTRIGLGLLEKGKLEIDCVDDVWSIGAAPAGNWTPPSSGDSPLNVEHSLLIPAPLWPASGGPRTFWCLAARQAAENGSQIWSKNSVTQAGYQLASTFDSAGFSLIGELAPDSGDGHIREDDTGTYWRFTPQGDLSAWMDLRNACYGGRSSSSGENMCYVASQDLRGGLAPEDCGEFIAFEMCQPDSGSYWRLTTVRRGLFDTTPKKFTCAHTVRLYFFGLSSVPKLFGSSQAPLANGYTVYTKFLTTTAKPETLLIGAADEYSHSYQSGQGDDAPWPCRRNELPWCPGHVEVKGTTLNGLYARAYDGMKIAHTWTSPIRFRWRMKDAHGNYDFAGECGVIMFPAGVTYHVQIRSALGGTVLEEAWITAANWTSYRDSTGYLYLEHAYNGGETSWYFFIEVFSDQDAIGLDYFDFSLTRATS